MFLKWFVEMINLKFAATKSAFRKYRPKNKTVFKTIKLTRLILIFLWHRLIKSSRGGCKILMQSCFEYLYIKNFIP